MNETVLFLWTIHGFNDATYTLHNNKEIQTDKGIISIKMIRGDIAKLDFSLH
jgi:hypothetical protein